MEIGSVTNPATPTQADQALNGLSDSFDTFLTLLTTQLQNQDPLEPMDSSEFTSQLVQFTQVEQSISQNQNLEQLISLFSGQNFNSLVNYLGKEVEIDAEAAYLSGGEAKWHYDFGLVKPDSVAITVFDSDGQVVSATTGVNQTGKHDFTWDGTDLAGNPVADGVYTVKILGTIGEETFEPKISSTGVVSSVESVDGESVLALGGLRIPADIVTKISDLAANGVTGP